MSNELPADGGGRTLGRLSEINVRQLHSVGEKRADGLAALGISTVLDLLIHYPYRYHDQTRQMAVADLEPGVEAWIVATVISCRAVHSGRGKPRVEVKLTDGTGDLNVTFFNQRWRTRQLTEGTEALFFGKLDVYRGKRQMVNPVVDLVGDRAGQIVPLYPASEKAGVASSEIASWVKEALERTGRFAEPLPGDVRSSHGLVDRTEAFAGIHRPHSMKEKEIARRRLAFDELLRLQLELVKRRLDLESSSSGIRHVVDPVGEVPDLVKGFIDRLPFPLTNAQIKAISDIGKDMASPLPMHRLLQGDVGAGKTVVAVSTLLVAVQGGMQGVLMAPTEVLAEQHYSSVSELLGDHQVADHTTLEGSRPLRVALLTSRVQLAKRSKVLEDLASGRIDIVIGTHALLTGDVRFKSIGAVVIDEQHRFGVEQRAQLRSKGREAGGLDPDMLVMTATPIPRTAAMVFFGDLDITVLDELPKGRSPIATKWVRTGEEIGSVWAKVREEVALGHRAYVVCPLVEGSEKVQARSVSEELARLSQAELGGLSLGLLHGQMKQADKEQSMAKFRSGETPVLVTTTVIEVGVDVTQATVMVIEDADRFGIAQLHQLRGRVGRSDLPSFCFLLCENDTPDAVKRLQAVEDSSDGFALAEADLELRGEGSILGARQKGRSDLRLASLRRGDYALIAEARQVAEELLVADLELDKHRLLRDEIHLFLGDEEAEFLLKS